MSGRTKNRGNLPDQFLTHYDNLSDEIVANTLDDTGYYEIAVDNYGLSHPDNLNVQFPEITSCCLHKHYCSKTDGQETFEDIKIQLAEHENEKFCLK